MLGNTTLSSMFSEHLGAELCCESMFKHSLAFTVFNTAFSFTFQPSHQKHTFTHT